MTLKFEAAIFNETVLAAVQQGEHHKDLSDDWADTHYIEVTAPSLDAAWSKMRQKYKAANGFVIKAIDKIDQ
ncbi:MAG: hypothetical protein COB93_12300 [Sneathiella sp.]|nr:MAG: hypothetical protein COB93_12300 [Sneathiella sp.]